MRRLYIAAGAALLAALAARELPARAARSSPQAARWEHLEWAFNTPSHQDARKAALNRLGGEGWELVSVVLRPDGGMTAFLKRRVP